MLPAVPATLARTVFSSFTLKEEAELGCWVSDRESGGVQQYAGEWRPYTCAVAFLAIFFNDSSWFPLTATRLKKSNRSLPRHTVMRTDFKKNRRKGKVSYQSVFGKT